jgi:hypothetical protein
LNKSRLPHSSTGAGFVYGTTPVSVPVSTILDGTSNTIAVIEARAESRPTPPQI